MTPGVEGCAQTLQVTFDSCLADPGAPVCEGVLPTLSACVVNPGAPGCGVVLPTLAQCIGSPGLQGCEVRLPSLAQCVASPGSPGCEAVLPAPVLCSKDPTLPVCQVSTPGQGNATAPIEDTQRVAVNLINRQSEPKANAGKGEPGQTEKNEKQAGPAPAENTGVKNEKPAAKLYCN